MPINVDKYTIVDKDIQQYTYDFVNKNNLIFHQDAGIFTNVTGTTWFDVSGNNNNGTLVNNPTFTSENGGGVFFNRTNNNYVSFSANPSVTTGMTIEIWSKLTSNDPLNSWLFGREFAYRILYQSNFIQFVVNTTNNSWYSSGTFVNINTTLHDNKICQIVAIYNGTNLLVYLNGSLAVTSSPSISGSLAAQTGSYLYNLMKHENTDVNVRNGEGTIYKHVIYNRVLSSDEILISFNSNKDRFGL